MRKAISPAWNSNNYYIQVFFFEAITVLFNMQQKCFMYYSSRILNRCALKGQDLIQVINF